MHMHFLVHQSKKVQSRRENWKPPDTVMPHVGINDLLLLHQNQGFLHYKSILKCQRILENSTVEVM